MDTDTTKPAGIKRTMPGVEFLAWALLAGAALILGGCGGSSPAPAPHGDELGSQAVSSANAPAELSQTPATPVQLVESTGTPGVDYAPDIIEVRYRPGAGKTALALPAPSAPNLRSNSILRQNKQFEPLTAAIAARYGIEIRREVYVPGFNWAAFDIPEGLDGGEVLAAIARDYAAVVARVGFSGIARAGFVPDDPDFVNSTVDSGPQWGQRRIGCAAAWDTTMGDPGLLIGVVDTGVSLLHEELVGQVLDPEVAFPDDKLDIANNDNTMEDGDGHGTAVCGVIVAATNNGRTVAGVASDCRVIPVKIANTGDFASYADMIAGVELAAQLGARVVNMSWYGSASTPDFEDALTALQAQGVLVVVCAGNSGSNTSAYPAKYDQCMSVGATNTYDVRTSFSNWGEDVDIAAPGEDLKVLTNTGLYRSWWGTSFSAPMVAGGAALLWSVAPHLSLANVRSILQSTGPPAGSFTPGTDVRRLSLGEALAAIPGLHAPEIDQLIMRDHADLTPIVSGDVQSVELYVNGELYDTKDAAPWTFNLDLTGYGFEVVNFEFRGVGTFATVSDSTAILVDGLDSVYNMQEGFENAPYQAVGYDARRLSPELLGELKQMAPGQWTPEDLADPDNGPAFWRSTVAGQTGDGMRYANFAADYGAYETDVMVTRRIDLTHARSAQLDFYTKYNIESSGSDHGCVLLTADEGSTFSQLSDGEQQAIYTGYEPDYIPQTIDLNDWLGRQVRIVFLFESDATGSGDQAGELAGWWLDELRVSGEWVMLGGLKISAGGTPGTVAGISAIDVEAVAPLFADHVDYWLDFAPLGEHDAYDLQLSGTDAPFSVHFNLTPALGLANQVAVVRATPLAADDYAGDPTLGEFYLFNHLGDVNADGMVDDADTAAYAAVVGLTSGDEGYIPFFDSNLDGVITESDAGAVGYYFGN